MLQNMIQTTETVNVNQGTAYSTTLSMNLCSTACYQVVVDVAATAKVFPSSGVDTSADTLTLANHGLWTGVKGQFTTSGSLPTGISAVTDYWIVKVDSSTVKIATSLANALAGTVVNITAAGTGDQTFTPTTFANGALAYQRTNVLASGSNDISSTAADWEDIDTATTITADATEWFTKIGPEYLGLRVRGTCTDGAMQLTIYALCRGEDKK
jgi:hypothetical protein